MKTHRHHRQQHGKLITPSSILEHYCAPTGEDGQYLCQGPKLHRQLDTAAAASPTGSVFDIADALDAAAGTDNLFDEPMISGGETATANNGAAKTANGSTAFADVSNGSTDATAELFPLILGGVLFVVVIAFTAFTLISLLRPRKDEERYDNCDDAPEPTNLEGSARAQMMKGAGEHNSWVMGRQNTVPQQSSSTLAPSSLGAIEEGSTDIDAGDGSALLSWSGLSCMYPSKKSNDITTLSEVTGHIRYKELVAIMGPSGGGKTTLMDILSGRKSLGNIGGELSLLGEIMKSSSSDSKTLLRDVAAYVPQNEHFFPNQTPEEAVAFAANLKLGKDERGDAVRKARIDQILDLVGISESSRKRAIGGTLAGGLVIRGLSGGERKRLALACAVAMKPSLLFLDEITSGLDSENAVMVIDLIKKMCVNMNVAAVVVIHQPSYEVFSRFDRLVLLSKGKSVFADKLSKIPSFYDDIGRGMPEKHLLANDMLSVASKWNEIEYTPRESPNVLVETKGAKLLRDIKERKKPTTLLQLKTVLFRQLMNHYVRNLTNLVARVLVYGSTSVLMGAVFWKIGEVEEGQSSLTYTQAQAAFGAGLFSCQGLYLLPFAQVSTFFFDKSLFASESSMGLYPAWVYSLSQVTLELWVMILCAFTQTCIAVPMMGLWNPSLSKLESFISYFAIFCASGAVGNAMVMLVSILMFSQDLAFMAGSGMVTAFLVLSGGFVPFPYMEDWIAWLQWVSPIKYSYQAFTSCLVSHTDVSVLLETLELDAPEGVSSNIGILIGIFVVSAACSVLALSRQREVR